MDALKAYCSNVIDQMEADLFEIRLDYPRPKDWGKSSIGMVKGYVDQLKAYLITNPFKRDADEIYFFKEVKPVVMGRLIYLTNVHNTEIDRPKPTESNAEQLDFLSDELEKIQVFFDGNTELYVYYKQKRDVLDDKLFTRNVNDRTSLNELPLKVDPVYFYGDPDFSTGFDYLFAQFRAYEWLSDHLENEMEALLLAGHEVPMENEDLDDDNKNNQAED